MGVEGTWLRGKIYKISCVNDPLESSVYIGSTAQSLKDRFRGHRTDYHDWKRCKLFGIINTKYCASFVLLNKGRCSIRLLEDYPCETRKQLLIREQYYIDLYADTRVNIGTAYASPEKIAINKKAMLAKLRQKIVCICGATISIGSRPSHLKSLKHIRKVPGPCADNSAARKPRRRHKKKSTTRFAIVSPATCGKIVSFMFTRESLLRKLSRLVREQYSRIAMVFFPGVSAEIISFMLAHRYALGKHGKITTEQLVRIALIVFPGTTDSMVRSYINVITQPYVGCWWKRIVSKMINPGTP